MSLNRTSLTEQESGRTRRLTVRLPLDCVAYLAAQERERDGWTVTRELESCVRLKMAASGWVKR